MHYYPSFVPKESGNHTGPVISLRSDGKFWGAGFMPPLPHPNMPHCLSGTEGTEFKISQVHAWKSRCLSWKLMQKHLWGPRIQNNTKNVWFRVIRESFPGSFSKKQWICQDCHILWVTLENAIVPVINRQRIVFRPQYFAEWEVWSKMSWCSFPLSPH